MQAKAPVMINDLDSGLARLAAAPVDRDLCDVEREVWARVELRRSVPTGTVLGNFVRVGSIALALGIGVASGTAIAAAAQPHEMAVFSLQAHLSPSNLLGAR